MLDVLSRFFESTKLCPTLNLQEFSNAKSPDIEGTLSFSLELSGGMGEKSNKKYPANLGEWKV